MMRKTKGACVVIATVLASLAAPSLVYAAGHTGFARATVKPVQKSIIGSGSANSNSIIGSGASGESIIGSGFIGQSIIGSGVDSQRKARK
jgi:hypothetical protein